MIREKETGNSSRRRMEHEGKSARTNECGGETEERRRKGDNPKTTGGYREKTSTKQAEEISQALNRSDRRRK